jgi:hypothetical protein
MSPPTESLQSIRSCAPYLIGSAGWANAEDAYDRTKILVKTGPEGEISSWPGGRFEPQTLASSSPIPDAFVYESANRLLMEHVP